MEEQPQVLILILLSLSSPPPEPSLLTVLILSLAGLLSLFRGGVRMQVVSLVPSGLYSMVSNMRLNLKSSTVSLHSSWHQVGSTWHILIGAVTPQW